MTHRLTGIILPVIFLRLLFSPRPMKTTQRIKLMFPLRLPVLALLFSLLALPLSSNHASADSLNEAQSLVLKSHAVIKSFMNDPNMVWFHENVDSAYGILIVPQMLRGGFVVGGSGGSGVLLVRDQQSGTWSYPAFYTIGSLSLGLQIGADASELVLMIMTEGGLNAMLSTELKVGADISVAAGPVGKNAKAQTADVLAFGRAKGMFGGISVEGAVIEPRYHWNNAYYGDMVSPVDILMRRSVNNRQAEPLRRAMPGSRNQPQTYTSSYSQPGYPANQGYDTGYPNNQAYPPPVNQENQYYPGTGGSASSPINTWQNPDQGGDGWRNPDDYRQQELPKY
ncbi:MAG: Lipid-binding SYLF domain-containing protein [Candidatus Electronema aureum]|uniref:Lipid-binding SYLF domain-containing protein n=1 Tax=Candidatus Electronema aureum TaxID=2005002 RepID=A0A521FZK1_9BACT|nr:MAG: Lipid-binding SYLF domain-containing protein [Candidatus Electronema aureum]